MKTLQFDKNFDKVAEIVYVDIMRFDVIVAVRTSDSDMTQAEAEELIDEALANSGVHRCGDTTVQVEPQKK